VQFVSRRIIARESGLKAGTGTASAARREQPCEEREESGLSSHRHLSTSTAEARPVVMAPARPTTMTDVSSAAWWPCAF